MYQGFAERQRTLCWNPIKNAAAEVMTLRHAGVAWLVAWCLFAAAAAALHRDASTRVWTGQQGDASREPWLEIIR